MTYKIVFFDVDGTLVDNETKKIPISTIKAIKKLKENGVTVVVATGRSYSLSKNLKEELGIDNFINFSGGYARIGNEEIYKSIIPNSYINKLISKSYELNDSMVYFGVEETHSNGLSKEVALPILEKIDCNFFPRIKKKLVEEEVLSACLFLDKGNIEDYQKTVPEMQFYQWGADVPNAYNIEFEGTNKANGVIACLKHLNIDKSEAIAFGDGGNDAEMLKEVGLGVAMGNAKPRLKNVADFVTKNVGEDGIEFALKKLEII